MSIALKPLHVAKSLEDLNKKVPNDKVKSSTPRVLCRLAEKMLLKARDEVLTGDEEQAYVLYMRFIDVFQAIRNSKAYRTEKKELDKLLSPGKASKALDEAEKLSKSLKERYAALSSPSEKKPKLDNSSEQDPPPDDQVVPSSPKGPLYRRPDGAQPLLPLGDSSLHSSRQDILPHMTARELYSHLQSSASDVLVLDCRSRNSYNASHPDSKKFPQWISVPEETVRNGVTDQSVSSFLLPSGRKLWKERAEKKWLVLVDEQEASESNSPIMALRDALIKWSTSTALPREPYILEGGYAMWHLSYAVTCIGVYKRKPSSDAPTKDLKQDQRSSDITSASFDYPEFPTLSELPETDVQTTTKQVSEDSSFVQHQQPSPSAPPNPSIVPTTAESTPMATNMFPTQQLQPHSYSTPGGVEPQFTMERSAYVPAVPMYPPPVMPSYAPLPPPSSTIPVSLTLEGESELLTPSLNEELPHSVLSHAEEEDSSLPLSQFTANHVGMVGYAQPHPTVVNELHGPTMVNAPPPPVASAAFSSNYNQPPQTEHPPIVPPQPHSFIQPQPMWQDQQPSPHQGQAQPTWYGVPAAQSTAPPSNQADMAQPQAPVPIQQPIGPGTNSNEILVHPANSRVFSGPFSDPPSYEQAKHLPAQPPTQQPIPPPTSLQQHAQVYQQQVVPHQQFSQFSQPQYQQTQLVHQPQVVYQVPPEVAERDAKIEHLIQLLVEKEREAESKASIDEQRKRKEAEEMKELSELKKSLESERNELEQARQRQHEAAERDLQSVRQKLEEERAQMANVLEQERLKIEAAKAQYMQEVQQRESALKQQKEQYEREIAERQRQNAVMQQLEERRKQEHLFSLRQGLPQGWEKRLDSTTGRFYYVDHNSKTTHWNPPSNWLNYQAEMQRQQQEKNHLAQLDQQQAALNARLRAQQQHGKPLAPHEIPPSKPVSARTTLPSVQPQTTKAPIVPSVSVPGESPAGHGTSAKPHPSVDRSTKPSVQPQSVGVGGPVLPDRSTKPVAVKKMTMTPALKKHKIENLQAVYGSACYALTGLRNLGNTCYMNSTLQCLGCTTTVVHLFTSSRYENEINYVNPLGKQGVVAMEFAWLMKAMWGGQYKSVSPRDFKGMIDRFVPQMRGTNQQDSQEFLAFLMDGLHEDLNRVKKREYILDVDNSKLSDGEAAKLAWLNHRKQNDSVIVDFFQGLFRSTVVCNNCKKRSVNFEPFMFLTLPIPPGGQAFKLEDCIRLFSAQEKVSRSCTSCNHSVAFKRMEIWKLPPILLINIKRFMFEGQWREKRQNYIDYPVREPLNLSQYVVGEQPKYYQLYAVSNHFGSLTGGHYTACCKNPYKKSFYNFDDQEVREALPRQIKSSAAYILFYTSVDLAPPKMMF